MASDPSGVDGAVQGEVLLACAAKHELKYVRPEVVRQADAPCVAGLQREKPRALCLRGVVAPRVHGHGGGVGGGASARLTARIHEDHPGEPTSHALTQNGTAACTLRG
jgi:hypothetical protein